VEKQILSPVRKFRINIYLLNNRASDFVKVQFVLQISSSQCDKNVQTPCRIAKALGWGYIIDHLLVSRVLWPAKHKRHVGAYFYRYLHNRRM